MAENNTSKEILEKAIQKVEAQTGQVYAHTMFELFDDLTILQDFAKALWGEESSYAREGGYTAVYPAHREWEEPDMIPVWQYHLQMMVVADDPIKYLGENI